MPIDEIKREVVDASEALVDWFKSQSIGPKMALVVMATTMTTALKHIDSPMFNDEFVCGFAKLLLETRERRIQH